MKIVFFELSLLVIVMVLTLFYAMPLAVATLDLNPSQGYFSPEAISYRYHLVKWVAAAYIGVSLLVVCFYIFRAKFDVSEFLAEFMLMLSCHSAFFIVVAWSLLAIFSRSNVSGQPFYFFSFNGVLNLCLAMILLFYLAHKDAKKRSIRK
ncbi:hypothetical protein [Arenicella xantha]|uniref:Uncharacterized protein n=1 Tax=Arenicella xantha TaxID=644221 RepID=A0A395JP74_9GAMM|nr:hypothetical protein [Arenicella xantha]RBP53434.1 hypothetical protein DFR28_101820 [Arenicella xantha]